jgi:predicted nucleic acid-binding protein
VDTRIIEWSLGAGESAVIAVAAKYAPAIAVLADAEARARARTSGVAVIGTLGIVLRAKRRGVVAAAAPLLRALIDAGFYVSEALARTALESVGESWS